VGGRDINKHMIILPHSAFTAELAPSLSDPAQIIKRPTLH